MPFRARGSSSITRQLSFIEQLFDEIIHDIDRERSTSYVVDVSRITRSYRSWYRRSSLRITFFRPIPVCPSDAFFFSFVLKTTRRNFPSRFSILIFTSFLSG